MFISGKIDQISFLINIRLKIFGFIDKITPFTYFFYDAPVKTQ